MSLYFKAIIFSLLYIVNQGRSSDFQDINKQGIALYKKYCLACHQTDGSGVPGMFPPLIKTEKVTGPADTLVKIIILGLEGPFEVAGQKYNQAMPPLDYLTDIEISEILTYVRSNFGNKASAITPKEVARVRSKIKKSP